MLKMSRLPMVGKNVPPDLEEKVRFPTEQNLLVDLHQILVCSEKITAPKPTNLTFMGKKEFNYFSCLFYFSCPAFLDISGPLFWSFYS